jgi:hypothetical protein
MRVLAARTAYCLQHLAQKDQGKNVLLTEGLVRAELHRRVAGVDGGRWRWGGARGRSCYRGSPRSWTLWIDSGWRCEGTAGVREDGNTPAE